MHLAEFLPLVLLEFAASACRAGRQRHIIAVSPGRAGKAVCARSCRCFGGITKQAQRARSAYHLASVRLVLALRTCGASFLRPRLHPAAGASRALQPHQLRARGATHCYRAISSARGIIARRGATGYARLALAGRRYVRICPTRAQVTCCLTLSALKLAGWAFFAWCGTGSLRCVRKRPRRAR